MFKVNNFTPFSGVFVVVFEYVNVSWVHFRRVLKRKFNKSDSKNNCQQFTFTLLIYIQSENVQLSLIFMLTRQTLISHQQEHHSVKTQGNFIVELTSKRYLISHLQETIFFHLQGHLKFFNLFPFRFLALVCILREDNFAKHGTLWFYSCQYLVIFMRQFHQLLMLQNFMAQKKRNNQ